MYFADMNEVEKLVRSIQADGLLWGACEYIIYTDTGSLCSLLLRKPLFFSLIQ